MHTKQTTTKVHQYTNGTMTIVRHLVYNVAGVRVGAVHETSVKGGHSKAVIFFDLFDVKGNRIMKSQTEIKRTRSMKSALRHFNKG